MAEVDSSEWPILRVRLRGRISADEARRLTEVFDSALDREERFVLVTSGIRASRESSAVMGPYFESRADDLARWCAGSVTIVQPAVVESVRRMFTSGRHDAPYPTWAVTDEDEARTWAAERLAPDPGSTVP